MTNCPICLEEITNGAYTSCGHYYCLDCILLWQKNHTCPLCRATLHITTTDEIEALQAQIDSLKNSKIISFFVGVERFFTAIVNSLGS